MKGGVERDSFKPIALGLRINGRRGEAPAKTTPRTMEGTFWHVIEIQAVIRDISTSAGACPGSLLRGLLAAG